MKQKNYRAWWRYWIPQFLFALEFWPYFRILSEIHYQRVDRMTMQVFSIEVWLLGKRRFIFDAFQRQDLR